MIQMFLNGRMLFPIRGRQIKQNFQEEDKMQKQEVTGFGMMSDGKKAGLYTL